MSISFKSFLTEMTGTVGKAGKSVYISAGSTKADSRAFQAAYPDNLFLYDKKLSSMISDSMSKIHAALQDVMETNAGDFNSIKVHNDLDVKYVAFAPSMKELIIGVEGKIDLLNHGEDKHDDKNLNYAAIVICQAKSSGLRHFEVYGDHVGDETPSKGKWPYVNKEFLNLLKTHEEGHYDDLIEIVKG